MCGSNFNLNFLFTKTFLFKFIPLLFILQLLVYIIWFLPPQKEIKQKLISDNEILYDDNVHPLNRSYLILWWVDSLQFFSPHIYGPRPGCPISCVSTGDRSLLNKSHALIFHMPQMDWKSLNDLPKYRFPGQKYFAFSQENEVYYPYQVDRDFIKHFDYVLSYKRDSYIPVVYSVANYKSVLNLTMVNKTDSVAYFASNCNSNNHRDDFVKELMKYTKVNSFGKCLNNIKEADYAKAKGRDKMTKREILNHHKFFLAFENTNNVKDYVTEKYYEALLAGTVPIYMGAHNIDDFTPADHSTIKVSDYKDAKELGEYINYLNENDDKYQEYLKWRDYPLKPNFIENAAFNKYDFQCRVCLSLTGGYFNQKTGERISTKT